MFASESIKKFSMFFNSLQQFILNNDMNGNGYERRVPFSPRFRDQWPVILFEFQWLSVFAVSLVRLR